MGGPPRRTSCLVAESPTFTGLGAPSLPGFPVSPLPGQCINLQPWLRALTHRVAPLMRGRPGRRRRRARATGLLPVGPRLAGAEAALPRGWGAAQCATTALAGAVPRPFVGGARGRFGGLGPVPGVVSLPFPPSRPACPVLRVAGRPVRVSLTLARWYAIPRGLCVPRARSGCPSGSPRVPFACVCARAPAASAPPPPLGGVLRAHLAQSRHWALVGPFHVVRAPLRVLPRSLAPSGVLWGGRSGPGSSLPGLACTPCGGCVPRGWWGAVPGGGWPATSVRGVWCQALSPPDRPSSGAGSRGTATRVSRVRSVRAWGTCTGSTACALAGRRCSLWGWRRGVPGGGAFHRCDGRLRSGAFPPPTAHPLGGLLESATHMLWARACGCGGPSLPLWPACPVGAAWRGGGGGPSPGGVACHRCQGRLVSGAVPPPAARPLGRAAGVPRPVCPGCGRCGRGDLAPAPQRAPLRAGVVRCWDGRRASPGGGAFNHCEGRLWSGAPPPLTARLLGGLLQSATHVLWVRVCGCGGPTLSPWPARPAGCVPRGWWGAVPGGRWPATVVRGVWCQALSLPRPPGLWDRQPGYHDPCVPGAVGVGVGTQHRFHSVRPCGPALLAVGVAEGCPRGGVPSTVVRGV